MLPLLRYIRLAITSCMLVFFWFCALNHHLCTYLIKQALGQITILVQAQNIATYASQANLSKQEQSNLKLIPLIKKYSVDSLGYKPTHNFTKVFNQKNKPLLWVVTASEKYNLNAYEWEFPMLGRVSYKGFFNQNLANIEKNKLSSANYDVGIRTVSAWSTLGWFNDPLLSSQLKKSTGNFCNLLFHELFHATFFKANNINSNENLANFIAHKATIAFLKNDTASLNLYLINYNQSKRLNAFLNKNTQLYNSYLDSIKNKENKLYLKQKYLTEMVKNLKKQTITNNSLLLKTAKEIMIEQNAYFIDYMQYASKQDSLEVVFNKFYKGSIKNMVQSLNQ